MPKLASWLGRSGPVDILMLNADGAEAHLVRGGRGEEIRGFCCPPDQAPSHIREIVDLLGRGRGPLRLALGPGWVWTATIDLPPMPRKELALVLARRAAKLSGLLPADVHFTARSLGPMLNQEQDTKETRYLLAVTSRARIESLRKELAGRGRRVSAVVPARLARLSYASSKLAGDENFAKQRSAIVIDIGDRTVVTSLISGELLLSQAVLEGNPTSVPTLPLSMLQELKNLDAFHRKAHRGEGVSCVFVLGMTEDRAKLFETAVKASLGGPTVQFEPALNCSQDENAFQRVALQSAAHDGPFSLDLRAPVPLRQVERAMVAAGIATGLLGVAALVADHFQDQAQLVLDRQQRSQQLAAGLETLDASDQAFEATVIELESQVKRLTAVTEIGFDPGITLARLGACLPHDLLANSFSVTSAELYGDVHITGRVAPDPVRAFRSLERLRTQLEDLPEIEQVAIEPDGDLGKSAEGEQPGMAFDMKARLRKETP